MFYLNSVNEEKQLILFIEGRLNSFEEIEKIVSETLSSNNNDKTLVIDLSKTDSINEKCLKAFQQLGLNHKLEFRNYSLYIGTLLNDYDLIKINSDSNVL